MNAWLETSYISIMLDLGKTALRRRFCEKGELCLYITS